MKTPIKPPSKLKHDKRRVMREAWRRYHFDPTCACSMKLALQKAWFNSRPARTFEELPEVDPDAPLDFHFNF